MQHTTRIGALRLVEASNYPLTAATRMERIYSDLAILDATPSGLEIIEIPDGVTLKALQNLTDAALKKAELT